MQPIGLQSWVDLSKANISNSNGKKITSSRSRDDPFSGLSLISSPMNASMPGVSATTDNLPTPSPNKSPLTGLRRKSLALLSPLQSNSIQRTQSHAKQSQYEDLRDMLANGKFKELKSSVRDSDWNVADEVRSRLWPMIAMGSVNDGASPGKMSSFYWETVQQMYGTIDEVAEDENRISSPTSPASGAILPGFTSPSYRMYYCLSPRGKSLCERVVNVIGYSYPEITFCPLLLPVTSLFLHFVGEEEAFHCVGKLLTASSNKKSGKVFLTQTKMEWQVGAEVCKNLTKKFSKSTYAFVLRSLSGNAPTANTGQSVEKKLEKFYENWPRWIFKHLPFNHLLRVLDCYLMEGFKVLYRVAIALLQIIAKTASSDTKLSRLIDSIGLESTLEQFLQEFPVSPQRLLKSAFAIRAFRGSEIRKIWVKCEMGIKAAASAANYSTTSSGNKTMTRSKSSDNMPTSQSQMDIQMMSHTLAIKELLTLWTWLPVRITMYSPVLLYTTEEHGCSLTTFFNRVESYEPTILIIKTTTDQVFGAYCSTSWSTRNTKDERGERQRYFGTGETFLFSLHPKRAKYPWVGLRPKPANESVTDDDENLSPNPKKVLQHAYELFMHADHHMISIGGGEGQGIVIDEDLRFGKSERCLTFDNPSLVQSDSSKSSGDFEVNVLEVIGFSNNMQ